MHVLEQRVVHAVSAGVGHPLELQPAADDLVAHLMDALLAQREDLIDEEDHARIVRLDDVLELVDDRLGRAHAEAATRELLLAEDALEGASTRGEDVAEVLGVVLEVRLHRQKVPGGNRELVELLDERGGGVVDPQLSLAHGGEPGDILERLVVVALDPADQLGQGVLRLTLEHVVEVPAVQEDALVHRGVRPTHDRGLALLLGVLRPGDRTADVRRQRAEADDVVGVDRRLHLLVRSDALVMQRDREPLALHLGAEVADAEDHREGILLDVRLDVGKKCLLHRERPLRGCAVDKEIPGGLESLHPSQTAGVKVYDAQGRAVGFGISH